MVSDNVSQDGSRQDSANARFLQYARTGDKTILQSLIREFADRAYNQARRITGRADGAEDAVQEAYLRLVITAQRYDGSVPFAAWLGRLVSSAALNHRAQQNRRAQLSDQVKTGISAMQNHGIPSEPPERPEVEALRTALDALPDRYRTPLTLYYFDGLNQNETAQALGLSARTIATQLARGLEHLRKKLGRAGFAMTSAGLLALFASIPTYAAPPSLKNSLLSAASERFASLARKSSERMAAVKSASGLALKTGFLKIAPVAALATAAAVAYLSLSRAPLADPSTGIHEIIPADQAMPSRGLIAHWTFDETQGTTAIDSSGNRNDGALIGDPRWVAGKTSGGLLFDGLAAHVRVPNSPSLNSIKNQMTVAAWVLKKDQPAEYCSIIGRRTGPKFDDLWTLLYTNDPGHPYYFSIFSTKTEGDVDLMGPSSHDDLGVWTHLAGVFTGTELRLFRNGKLAGSAPGKVAIPDETTPLVIGASDSGSYGMAEFTNAIIDDVRLYDRALDDAEIAALAR